MSDDNNTLKSWDASELEDNLSNVYHDGDSVQLECPDCGLFSALTLSIAIEHGDVSCERCGSTYGLLLVKQVKEGMGR